MEPEYIGFCRGCNSFSEHLRIRPVKNNNTGTMEVSMFCHDCLKRFCIYPYDKREMHDAKLKEGQTL